MSKTNELLERCTRRGARGFWLRWGKDEKDRENRGLNFGSDQMQLKRGRMPLNRKGREDVEEECKLIDSLLVRTKEKSSTERSTAIFSGKEKREGLDSYPEDG